LDIINQRTHKKKWLSDLKKCNWFCCVQKDFDSAVNLINQYFKNDLLWEIYQDNDIPLDEFKKHFRDFRHFLDAKKQLFKTK
jgi:hypothetical protein